jgi:vitamin B12 transporter
LKLGEDRAIERFISGIPSLSVCCGSKTHNKMKTKKLYIAVCLGLTQLALTIVIARAQEKPVAILDEVVVTASRSPKKISEIGKVVRVISSETLSRSQGRTLHEVLNNVAGITIGGNGSNPADVKAVYMRGASASNTLILIDGIPVNDASEISGEYNISAISVDLIERIEILKGGNSTLYGSDAVAGVINIITKKGFGKLSANVMATAGSYNTYKQVLGLQGEIKNTSISLNASNTDSENFSSAKPASTMSNFDKDGFHQKSLNLNLGQKINDKFSLRANFQANNNTADLDNGAFDDALNYTYGKSSFLAGIGGRMLLNNGLINVNISQNNINNQYNNQGSKTNNYGNISHLEANLNYKFNNNLDIASGVSFRKLNTEQNNPYGPKLKADNQIGSTFTSLFFRTKTGFQAEFGGRINQHSEYGNNFTYTINPSYLFADRYKLFVNLSSAYRVPSLYQLFSDYGNLALKPENTSSFEAGLDLNFSEKMNFSFSYFKRDIENVIDFGQIASNRFGYINQNRQKDNGFELEFVYKPISFLSFNAYYAFVDGEIETPTIKEFNLFRRPQNSYGLNAALDLSKKISLNLIYKRTGDRLDRYYDGATYKTLEAKLDSFDMIDAYIEYQPKSNLTLFSDVKNLLNKDYVEFAGYQTKGLNFNAGFRLGIQ